MESAQAPIAIIVPTRNRWAKTARFLTAIAQQTYPHCQVIVVDAQSSDGTPARVAADFPSVTVLRVSDRHFWAGATNVGVRHALSIGAAYILTINDDAVIAPDYVECLVTLARLHQCQILGNQINYLEPPDRIWALGTYTHWGSQNFLRLAYCDQATASLPAEVRDRPVMPIDALPGNGVLIERQVFAQIGLYNDRLLPHYHADSEFTMRAQRAGIQPYVTPQVILHNDFEIGQKTLNLKSPAGLWAALFRQKSHLYLPALVYIFCRYCPPRYQWQTLTALGQRWQRLRQA